MFCLGASDPAVPFNGGVIKHSELVQKEQKVLQARLKELSQHPLMDKSSYLSQSYNTTFHPIPKTVAQVAVAVAVGAVVFAFLRSLTGNNISSLFKIETLKAIPIEYGAIGGGVCTIWAGGAVFIIVRAARKENPLLGGARGKFGDISRHIESGYISRKDGKRLPTGVFHGVYIDRSTLNEKGSGKAFLYTPKTLNDHYMVSSVVAFLGSPFYAVSAVAYNLIHAAIIPFYILFHCATSKEPKFSLTDAPKESFNSLKRAVKAPFYALAYMFCAFYSIFNPMGGRNLAAAVERDWNGDKALNEGFWWIGGSLALFKWENFGNPGSPLRAPWYMAGCWQPVGIATYKKGKITKCISMEKALDKENPNWCSYNILTESEVTEYLTINNLDFKE